MSINLLVNPGFEDGYRPLTAPDGTKPHHIAYVSEVQVTGGPITKRYTVERGEIHNPAGWWSWYAHQRNNSPVPWDPHNTLGWCEPEIRVSDPTHARHRSGSHAGYLFTYRRIHEGGLFQQVQVTPGARYRFTAFGHAWISNDDSQPPSCSLPGCGALAYPVGAAGLNDDQRSVRLYVGIDPLGGNNPYSQSVVWSDGWHIFNAYSEEPLSVEAVAQNDTITVYLLSSTLWPVIHNDVAWDDCALELLDAPTPPEPGNGAPREQYARVVNVLPPTVTPERAAAVFAACWQAGRQTVSGSYDDAGVGDLSDRTAVLWDIPEADEPTFRDWYAVHYPGVKVQFAGHADAPPKVKVYSQRDVRWKAERMLPSSVTVGEAGCAMVSACMLATQVDADLTPLELNRRLSANGGYTATGLLYWRKVAEVVDGLDFLGYTTWRTDPKPDADIEQVRAALAAGPAVIQVDHHPGGLLDSHFVLALRMLDDADIEIADPWYGDVTTLRTRYWRGSLEQSIYALAEYGAQPEPDPEPPQPNVNGGQLLGLHLQSIEPGALEFIAAVKPNVVKIFDPGMAQAVKAASSKTLVVYRHHISREDELACLADPVNRSRWFLDQFAEQVRPLVDAGLIDYVETAVNETMDGDKVQAAVTFELAFIAELARQIRGAKPLVATIAVGNPHESQCGLLLPLAREVARVGGAFGYHAYWPVQVGDSALEATWDYHAGRFEGMDALFRQGGFVVDWILSECGPCGGEWQGSHFAYDPAAGWRDPRCHGGDFGELLFDLGEFVDALRVSPARVIGATWFTLCAWDWYSFNLSAGELQALGNMLAP